MLGCGASWAEAPKAVEPVAQHVFPVTGESLQRLSDSFYALCGRDEAARSASCVKAKDTLNEFIRAYNKANDFVLEAY